MGFPIRQSSADPRPCPGCFPWIDSVNVEAKVDLFHPLGCCRDGILHHLPHPKLVDLSHRENGHLRLRDRDGLFGVETPPPYEDGIFLHGFWRSPTEIGEPGMTIAKDGGECHP